MIRIGLNLYKFLSRVFYFVLQAPKSLLSLGAMLNEYVCLKEQRVMMDQERVRLDQEKFRVQTLLQGMQNIMNVYNSNGSQSVPSIPTGASKPMVVLPQSQPVSGPPAGTFFKWLVGLIDFVLELFRAW